MLTESEKERRRILVRAHMSAENRHDLDGIMETFAAETTMLYNRLPFPDPPSIREAHTYFGMSAANGAFDGVAVVPDHEHFTDDEVVIEGRMCGKHVGEFLGFAPTGRDVELAYVAFYRFDAGGKLVSERVVMNLAPLAVA